MQGKVTRDERNGRLSRASATKKMTVELVQGRPGQGPFVWPEVPEEDMKRWRAELDEREKKAEERRLRSRPDESFKLEPEDAQGLKERARLLLQGKVRWRPSWEETGAPALKKAMGRD